MAEHADNDTGRQRILVAVEPRVLSHALAEVLRHREATEVEVIDLRDGDAAPPTDGHYDAAIVTIDLTDVDAEVVIELPDHEVHLRGLVTQEGSSEAVVLDGLDALLDLLDRRLERGST